MKIKQTAIHKTQEEEEEEEGRTTWDETETGIKRENDTIWSK